MGDVGKRLFPTFASGGTGFEFVSFPLVQAFNWDGTNLLKLGDRKQLETEPEQNSGDQYTLSPLQQRKEISGFLPRLPNLALRREPSHIFNGNHALLKAAL